VSKEYHELLGKPELQKPTKCLQGPDNQPLAKCHVVMIIRQFEELFHTNASPSSKQHIFVIDHLRANLLSLPTIVAHNLVARIDNEMMPFPKEIRCSLCICKMLECKYPA